MRVPVNTVAMPLPVLRRPALRRSSQPWRSAGAGIGASVVAGVAAGGGVGSTVCGAVVSAAGKGGAPVGDGAAGVFLRKNENIFQSQVSSPFYETPFHLPDRLRRVIGSTCALLALVLTMPIAAQAQSPRAKAAEPAAVQSAQTHRFTLANGMTVIVRPDRRSPTVAHMLWVRVGSIDEVDGTSGVAHVLEHMMFKGTPDLKPGEFSRRVAALGGRDNAFTSRDATAYHQQVPVRQLEAVMRLEADRFARNQWPDDEFTREIEVVKEERRQRTEESPRARMFEAFNAMAFQATLTADPSSAG
jgi:hypothetical protein